MVLLCVLVLGVTLLLWHGVKVPVLSSWCESPMYLIRAVRLWFLGLDRQPGKTWIPEVGLVDVSLRWLWSLGCRL